MKSRDYPTKPIIKQRGNREELENLYTLCQKF